MKKALKIFELIVLFIGIPLIMYFDVLPFHKVIPLAAGTLYVVIILIFDKTFDRKELGMNGFQQFRPMFFRVLGVLVILTITSWIIVPEYIFFLPRHITWLWIVIILMYPVWSVIPQELIYRTFFFHRYKDIFPRNTSMIAASALTFSVMHIIFKNPVAIVFSLIAGLVLSILYSRHRSLLGITIEHALYGILVFTTGLGTFFYIT